MKTRSPLRGPLSAAVLATLGATAVTLVLGSVLRRGGLAVGLPAASAAVSALGTAILSMAVALFLDRRPQGDRLTIFFLVAALGVPVIYFGALAAALREYGFHGVFLTNRAFDWPNYLGQHLLLFAPGLAVAAGALAAVLPPRAAAGSAAPAGGQIADLLYTDWMRWFWLEPLILSALAVLGSVILGAGALAHRLSAWFALELIGLSALQLLIWFAVRRRGIGRNPLLQIAMIGLPFLNWARLPLLQEHGPGAVGGGVGMWTVAVLVVTVLSARLLWPTMAVIAASTVSMVVAYFHHQHADAWFEQAMIAALAGSFCLVLVLAAHGRFRRDTQDRLALAEALRREQEARERAHRETERRQRVLRAIGHDLRQPLSALQLWFYASRRKGDAMPELDAAEASVTAAHEILDSIAQLAWIIDGEKEPRLEDVPLTPLLDDLATEVRVMADMAGIELRCRSLQATVRTDSYLLRRILRNFLVNAVRHGGGTILLAARRRGGHVHLMVIDRGPGIAHDAQATIFDEFARGGSGTEEGFGVGLAVARDLAAALGHDLTLCSEPGAGSAFGVKVPLAR